MLKSNQALKIQAEIISWAKNLFLLIGKKFNDKIKTIGLLSINARATCVEDHKLFRF